jgi:AraC-like DNA-binding protein
LVRCPSPPHAASAQRPDPASAPRCPRCWRQRRSTCVPCASAGYRVGHHDAAHFNREYKRLFGVLPIRDVQRLRQAASAVSSR